MTTPQTDAPTLQERLRAADIFQPDDEDLQDKAADALDAHEATIAAMVEALKFYADENNNLPSEGPWGINSTDFGLIARAALSKAAALK